MQLKLQWGLLVKSQSGVSAKGGVTVPRLDISPEIPPAEISRPTGGDVYADHTPIQMYPHGPGDARPSETRATREKGGPIHRNNNFH